MFTKTIYALTAVLLLSAPSASAFEEGAASAYAIPHDRGTEARAAANQNHVVTGTQAYASTGRNGIVRQQPRNVRPFTEQERLWFRTAQGYEDRF
jgi:hypothetical protein